MFQSDIKEIKNGSKIVLFVPYWSPYYKMLNSVRPISIGRWKSRYGKVTSLLKCLSNLHVLPKTIVLNEFYRGCHVHGLPQFNRVICREGPCEIISHKSMFRGGSGEAEKRIEDGKDHW